MVLHRQVETTPGLPRELLTSTDGASRTLQPVPPAAEPVLRGVAGSGSRYVAVGRQWVAVGRSVNASLVLTSP